MATIEESEINWVGQSNQGKILKALENPPTRLHENKQRQQKTPGNKKGVQENNRTPEEEENKTGKTENTYISTTL